MGWRHFAIRSAMINEDRDVEQHRQIGLQTVIVGGPASVANEGRRDENLSPPLSPFVALRHSVDEKCATDRVTDEHGTIVQPAKLIG